MMIIIGRKKKICILFGLFTLTAVFLFESFYTGYDKYVKPIIRDSNIPVKSYDLHQTLFKNDTKSEVEPILTYSPWNLNLDGITNKILNSMHYRKEKELMPNCKTERRNFVYIKNHKCGSDNMAAMFRRFGYTRNLSVVLPVGKRYNIGWPYKLQPSYYRTSKINNSFNILCDHTVYNESYMTNLMPKDTLYMTTIREPFERLKSAFFFFGEEKISRIVEQTSNANDQLEIFLKDPRKYDEIFMQPDPIVMRPCVPNYLSIAKNAMAFDLGFPIGYHEGTIDMQANFTYITQWLHHIDQRFELVMLLDHLDESLVMLKRMMCWSFKDILFTKISTSNPNKRITRTFSKELIESYHTWSFVDYILYKHFQRTFWERIHQMGLSDFMEEVQTYKNILSITLEFCKNEQVKDFIEFSQTRWGDAFILNKQDCALIRSELRDELREQYDNNPTEVTQPKGPILGC